MYTLVTGETVEDSRPGENTRQWLDRIGKKLADFTLEDVAEILSLPLDWHCVDCGFDTFPEDDGRASVEAAREGRDHKLSYPTFRTEVYTVNQEVWDASGIDSHGGCLCVDCLEERIGRRLQPSDFPKDNGLNTFPPYVYTPRLASRMFDLTRQERRALAAEEKRVRKQRLNQRRGG